MDMKYFSYPHKELVCTGSKEIDEGSSALTHIFSHLETHMKTHLSQDPFFIIFFKKYIFYL